jgi:hypothetical protein
MSHTGLFCTFFLLTTGRKKQKERPFFVRPIAPHTVFSLERDGAITFISLELHTHTHTQKTTSSRPPHRYHKQDKQENEKKNNNNTKKKKLEKYARESLRARNDILNTDVTSTSWHQSLRIRVPYFPYDSIWGHLEASPSTTSNRWFVSWEHENKREKRKKNKKGSQ